MEEESQYRAWDNASVRNWIVVFILNLPVAWWMASIDYRGAWAHLGISLACVCLMAIGIYFAGRGSRVVRMITLGGCAMALIQVAQLPHMILGLLAIGTWNEAAKLAGVQSKELLFFECYGVTLLMGQALILLSLIMGFAMQRLWHFAKRRG